MALKTGILALGAKSPGRIWEEKCRGLGVQRDRVLIKHLPSKREIRGFFRRSPDWIFLSGHFSGMELYNNEFNRFLRFTRKLVKVTINEDDGTEDISYLSKRRGRFNLHKNCKVVFWGGCSVCSSRNTISILRELFGPHLLLGYAASTGSKITNPLLRGGKIIKSLVIPEDESFFARLDPKKLHDPVHIRDAWMQTALDAYGGRSYERLIRAVDPDGQEHRILKGKIKRNRKH